MRGPHLIVEMAPRTRTAVPPQPATLVQPKLPATLACQNYISLASLAQGMKRAQSNLVQFRRAVQGGGSVSDLGAHGIHLSGDPHWELATVPTSVSTDMLLQELGQCPLSHVWWRCTVKFWNALVDLPNASMYKQVALNSCWDAATREVKN